MALQACRVFQAAADGCFPWVAIAALVKLTQRLKQYTGRVNCAASAGFWQAAAHAFAVRVVSLHIPHDGNAERLVQTADIGCRHGLGYSDSTWETEADLKNDQVALAQKCLQVLVVLTST